MNTKKSLLMASIATAGIAMASTASAQDMYKSGVGGLYAGVNYTFMNADFDGIADADVGTLSGKVGVMATEYFGVRSEEHTSELQSRPHLVCRLLLEKNK